jgi:hypothetical protein
MYHYIILSNRAPARPYEIQENYVLKPVKPLKKMWKDFTWGLAPHGYNVVTAFPYIDGASYNIYRDLIMFHSFIRNDPETYIYGEHAFAFNKAFEDSELKVHNSKSVQKVDFDHFPMLTVSEPEISHKECEEFDEATELKTLSECERSAKWIPEPSEEINYKKAFRLFTELKVNKKKLYHQICLYVYLNTFHNAVQLYCNDYMRVAFYIAILESMIGKPAKCKKKFNCKICKRRDIDHYKETLEQRFWTKCKERFEGLEELREIRHKVFHEAHYLDILDPLYEIYYRRQIRRKILEKCSTDEERALIYKQEEESIEDESKWDEHERQIEKLRLVVRRGLIDKFFQQYKKVVE